MKSKREHEEFRDKIMAGVNKAVKQLVLSSAEKNEDLVVADKYGNVKYVAAKELIKTVA